MKKHFLTMPFMAISYALGAKDGAVSAAVMPRQPVGLGGELYGHIQQLFKVCGQTILRHTKTTRMLFWCVVAALFATSCASFAVSERKTEGQRTAEERKNVILKNSYSPFVDGYARTGSSTLVQHTVQNTTPAKTSVEAVTVSAVDLYNAYESNSLKADKNYKGKTVRLTGEVSKVANDIFKEPYMALITGDWGVDWVHVYFKTTELSKVADLDGGETIAVVGKCEGMSGVLIKIRDAFFE